MTLVTWGAMTFETLKAATSAGRGRYQRRGDRRGDDQPLDHGHDPRIGGERPGAASSSTKRRDTGGVGAEIAAGVAEKGLYDLLAPIQRVTGYDTVMPLFRMEYQYLPSVRRIVDAAKATLED